MPRIKEPLMEIYASDLIKFQECPWKWQMGNESDKNLTPSERFHALCRQYVTNIAKEVLLGNQMKSEGYIKRSRHDVENGFYGLSKDNAIKAYTDRIERVIVNFLADFCYSGQRTLVGMGLASGVTEEGVRVLAGSDVTATAVTSKITRTYIFSFSQEHSNPFFNSNIIRAAVLHEGHLREGIQVLVSLYNLNTGESVDYNHPVLHKNIMNTIQALCSRFRLEDVYRNIGTWCTYCPYLQECYKEAIRK